MSSIIKIKYYNSNNEKYSKYEIKLPGRPFDLNVWVIKDFIEVKCFSFPWIANCVRLH